MRSVDESSVQRRRGDGIVSVYEAMKQAPASSRVSEQYVVTIGVGPFPTTGRGTVFMVQLLPPQPRQNLEGSFTLIMPSGGAKFPAINLGDGIPIQDETIVRCDVLGGQLFFTYRGNGVAT